MDHHTLDALRRQLDQVDHRIVDLLAQRFEICRQVAAYKKARGLPTMQPARVSVVKQKAAAHARATGIDEQFVVALYGAIIAEACRLEDDVIASR
jgi:chorismate mutase